MAGFRPPATNKGGLMKTVSKLLLSLCLVVGFGAVAAHAQIESGVTIEANIPHAFVVGKTQLPPGKYTVKTAEDSDDLNVLEIRSADGRTAVFFETENIRDNQRPGKSELVFDQVGDQYFLSQVFLKGDDSGNQAIKSRMEQKLEARGMKAERRSVAAEMVRAVKAVGKKIT
jgi:hypothetical protein